MNKFLFLLNVFVMIFASICAIVAAITAFLFDDYETWFQHTVLTVGFILIAYLSCEFATLLAKKILQK